MTTRQTDLPFHDTRFRTNGLAGREADHARLLSLFVVAACSGLLDDAVLGSEQLADERMGHLFVGWCGLHGFRVGGILVSLLFLLAWRLGEVSGSVEEDGG